MKKTLISIVIILTVIILIALVFDWGRRGSELSDIIIKENSTSTSGMSIVVNYPLDNQEVSSPIKITGKAVGNWFFEASFPVQLVDSDGNVIGSTPAQAESDWMTTDFVNFSAELSYTKSTTTDNGLIILSNDNPSGDPARSKSIVIPVKLK